MCYWSSFCVAGLLNTEISISVLQYHPVQQSGVPVDFIATVAIAAMGLNSVIAWYKDSLSQIQYQTYNRGNEAMKLFLLDYLTKLLDDKKDNATRLAEYADQKVGDLSIADCDEVGSKKKKSQLLEDRENKARKILNSLNNLNSVIGVEGYWILIIQNITLLCCVFSIFVMVYAPQLSMQKWFNNQFLIALFFPVFILCIIMFFRIIYGIFPIRILYSMRNLVSWREWWKLLMFWISFEKVLLTLLLDWSGQKDLKKVSKLVDEL